MTMSIPDMPKPEVGDVLTLVRHKTRYHEERITKVTVIKVARYKITATDPGQPSYLDPMEFDIRTGAVWDTTPASRRVGGAHPRTLFTEEQWAYYQRDRAASAYLQEVGIPTYQIRGKLRDAIKADEIGFVNALRRSEGLDEI